MALPGVGDDIAVLAGVELGVVGEIVYGAGLGIGEGIGHFFELPGGAYLVDEILEIAVDVGHAYG